MRTKRMRTTKNMKHVKHAKKLLCCVLTGCMLAGMVPSAVAAETGEPNATEAPTAPETPTTPATPAAPEAPAALSTPTVPTTPTTPATPAAIEVPEASAAPESPAAPEAPTADGVPAAQSDTDDEVGISLLGVDEDGSVSYLDYDTTDKKMVESTITKGNYTTVTNSAVGITWETGWYVVEDPDVTIEGTVEFTGDVHLILCDGADLTVTGGITDNSGSNHTLTIYAQSDGTADTGKLTVTNTGIMGIRANSRNDGLIINGGVIDATGGRSDKNKSYGIYGYLTINGGSVTGHGGSSWDASYGICASNLTVNGGTIRGTYNNEGENRNGFADIYVTLLKGISGGKFTADVEIESISSAGNSLISGGIFENKLSVLEENIYITDLLAKDHVFQTIGEHTVPLPWTSVEYQTSIECVTVSPCSHDKPDADGKCPGCGNELVASRTGGERTTYYTNCGSAVEAAETGDTITLLADVRDGIECDSLSVTLDLNGKTLNWLLVHKTAITVTDSVGGGKIATLITDDGVKVIDLLQESYAFKDENSKWYDATHNTEEDWISNAVVRALPALTLTPASSGLTTGYKAAATAVISAAVRGTDGVEPVNYQWYVKNRSDSDFGEPETATGAAFHFPEGKAAGSYEVKCEADCDGYRLSQTVTVTVSQPSSSGGASAPIIAPSEKPADKPENRPSLDRDELRYEIWRLPFRLIRVLHLPMLPFSRLTWAWVLDLEFWK